MGDPLPWKAAEDRPGALARRWGRGSWLAGVAVELRGGSAHRAWGDQRSHMARREGVLGSPPGPPPSRVEWSPEHELLEFSRPCFWENAQFVGTHCSGACASDVRILRLPWGIFRALCPGACELLLFGSPKHAL